MKPVYCNNSTVNLNPKTGEVSISFSHIYTDHSLSVDRNGLTDVSAKLVEEEAHVIMSREAFIGLKRVMDNIWEKMQENRE